MDIIHIVVLAVVQGLTEFVPISSSAHLILVPNLLGWEDQGLAFDVSVHVGTLVAVVWYFRTEVYQMARDWILCLVRRENVGESRLAWAVILGTIPAGVIGMLSKDFVELYLRSPLLIAGTTIGFGLLLWYFDRTGKMTRDESTISLRDALIIGFAQALALIPGTSRSGITITAGLMLGLDRKGASRFSFLLSIPLIIAAGLLLGKDMIESSAPVDWGALGLGTVLSAISAYTCIHFFLKLLERTGMTPYIIYRLLLGVFLLWFFL